MMMMLMMTYELFASKYLLLLNAPYYIFKRIKFKVYNLRNQRRKFCRIATEVEKIILI